MDGNLTVYVKIKEEFQEADGTTTVQVVDPADRKDRGLPVTFSAGESTADFTYAATTRAKRSGHLRLPASK